MRIMIVTDAWFPQVNGVVRTLKATADELGKRGHDVIMVTPEGRWTFPLPSYPEIRLSLISAARIAQKSKTRTRRRYTSRRKDRSAGQPAGIV